jgi:hypothetical protein
MWVNRNVNRKLTREQARFIIWCLAYDRLQRKAQGSRYHTRGLIPKLARKFGVTVQCIYQIKLHRNWREIHWPHPKQHFSTVLGHQQSGKTP